MPKNPFNPETEWTLYLAFSRGCDLSTFATADEYRTPGYSGAYASGVRIAELEREREALRSVIKQGVLALQTDMHFSNERVLNALRAFVGNASALLAKP